MTIDLRKYYLGSSDELEWDLELSGMELGGVKPFCAPVKVRGQLKGSPDSVELSGTAVYTMTMPCDRCFELTTQERELSFFHVLVRALSDEEDDNGEFVVVPDDFGPAPHRGHPAGCAQQVPLLPRVQGPVPYLREKPEPGPLRLRERYRRPAPGGFKRPAVTSRPWQMPDKFLLETEPFHRSAADGRISSSKD